MKNWFIKLICFLCLRPKIKPKKERRILIVSTTGLGDTLWGTPALRALKTKHPDAFIGVLTSPVGKVALKNNPYIDKLFLIKTPFLYLRLRKEKFDTIYVFHASQRIIFPLCYLLAPSYFIGTVGINKGLDSLFTELKPHLYEHEIVRRLGLIEMKEASKQMDFFGTSQTGLRLPSNSYGIHPGAKDPFKQWDPAHYITVANQLKERGGTIFLSGTEAERPLLDSMAKEIREAQVLILPLPEFAEHLKQFRCFITNDTGPMHLAFALKVPTVALFASTDPSLCGPLEVSSARLVKVPATCSPCLKQKCKKPFCLEQISVAEVMSLIP